MKVLLSQGKDADSSFWLAQVIVDADQRLHCSFWAALVLMLLVVQRLGKCMTLLSQCPQSPAAT